MRHNRFTLHCSWLLVTAGGQSGVDLSNDIERGGSWLQKPTVLSNIADETFKAHEQTMEGLREGAAKATAGFDQAHARVEEGVEQAQRAVATTVGFGRETTEVYAKSFLVWSAGWQDLSRQHAAAFQAALEEATRQVKAVNAAGSVKEAMELQAVLIRTSADRAVADLGRLASGYIKVTADAFAPILAAMGRASERLAKPA